MPREKVFIFIMLLLILSGGYYAFFVKMKSIVKNEDQLAETRIEIKAPKSDNSKDQEVKPGFTKNTSGFIQDSHKEEIKSGRENLLKPNQKDNVGSNIIDSIKPKINIEITLIDGLKNQVLESYSAEIKFIDENGAEKIEKCQTNKTGKLNLSASMIGLIYLQIVTKDFGSFAKEMRVGFGNNKVKAILFKGGTIEIRAIGEKNQAIIGLTAKVSRAQQFESNNHIHGAQKATPIFYDVDRSVYIMSQVAIGNQEIVFGAKGYQESPSYILSVNTGNIVKLEIKLTLARRLTLELDIQSKPDFVEIANTEYGYENKSESLLQMANEKRRIIKNKMNLYEFIFEDNCTNYLTVFINKHMPFHLEIIKGQDYYKIKPKKGFSGKFKIINELGKPIEGAIVAFSQPEYYEVLTTKIDGIVEIDGLTESEILYFVVMHKEYGRISLSLTEKVNDNISEVIELKKSQIVSGKIFFNGKPVKDAMVSLGSVSETIEEEHIEFLTKTESDGSYSIYSKEIIEDRSYYINAYQDECGIAKSKKFKFDKNYQTIDLSLEKKKSVTIKIVDDSGAPMPYLNLFLYIHPLAFSTDSNFSSFSNGYEHAIFRSFETDENGECIFYNLIPGDYNANFSNEKYNMHEGGAFQVEKTANYIVLTAEKINARKLIVSYFNGNNYRGPISVVESVSGKEFDMFKDESGDMFINFSERHFQNSNLIFEAFGHKPISLGPFINESFVPDELNIKLLEIEDESNENKIKIKFVNALDNMPLPFVLVNIFDKNHYTLSLPTDAKGEVFFTDLKGEFNIDVVLENFAAYYAKLNCYQTKEFVVKLIKGGNIKGHLTLEEKYLSAAMRLDDCSFDLLLDSEGYFEVKNIIPGDYSVVLVKKNQDFKLWHSKIIPIRVQVENEKTIVINFDDFLDNTTSLEVSVNKDGTLLKKGGTILILNHLGRIVEYKELEDEKVVFDNVSPGVYNLEYRESNFSYKKTILVKARKSNIESIVCQDTTLNLVIKIEEGNLFENIIAHLYEGDKFQLVDLLFENKARGVASDGKTSFLLLPKKRYFIVVESNINCNLQPKIIDSIELGEGQSSTIEVVLPRGRKLPNIQIVDKLNRPLSEAFYVYSEKNDSFFQRNFAHQLRNRPCSDEKGFLPENGWPKSSFKLRICKEGFEFKEVFIAENFDGSINMKIQLNLASSIKCDFKTALSDPVSVGVLNSKGELLETPLFLLPKYNEIPFYFEGVSFGSVKFSELPAGTYYIGYFENGSTKLISKQGPFTIGVEENLVVTSTYK